MNPEPEYIDQPVTARANELPDLVKLRAYLTSKDLVKHEELAVEQFPGGYSNLTFLLKLGAREYVLRKPPFGANIKSAHDMGREFNVISALKPVFAAVPEPVLYCEDEQVIGTPFYIMERVRGVILRNRLPKGLAIHAETMRSISEAAIDKLSALHSIDIYSTGLINLGKPEGYVQRQV
jgi:aminoglycoside phosphotransferase (APT) family kinase protein